MLHRPDQVRDGEGFPQQGRRRQRTIDPDRRGCDAVRSPGRLSRIETEQPCRKIAAVEGIPGPGGKSWGDTTIRGNLKRATGIVNNELYIGRLIWNRLRYIKDPSTGKRVSRLNPVSEWIVKDVPDLRIVDDELWQVVRERQGEIAEKFVNVTEALRKHHRKNKLNGARRPRTLLSGLIF